MFDGAVQKGALEVQNSIETQKKISLCTCSKPVVCIMSEVFQGASKHAVQAISNIRTVVGLRFQICVEEREVLKKVWEENVDNVRIRAGEAVQVRWKIFSSLEIASWLDITKNVQGRGERILGE